MSDRSDYSVNIILESKSFIAGEYVSGDILVNSSEINCSLILTSSGSEKLTIKVPKLDDKSHISSIFTVTKTLSASTRSYQELYPFSFKIPDFCPSTFTLNHTLPENTHVIAEVSYTIFVALTYGSEELLKCSKSIIILNKHTGRNEETKVEATQALRSCLCFPRGNVNLSVCGSNAHDSICGDSYKYQISLNSSANKHLDSLVSQVVFVFSTRVPNEEPVFFQKAISRTVTNIEGIKNSNEIKIIVDLGMDAGEIAGDLCSNECVLMSSKYILQVFAVYNVGWRSKLVQLEKALHVSPNIQSQDSNLLYDFKPVKMPENVFVVEEDNSRLYKAFSIL